MTISVIVQVLIIVGKPLPSASDNKMIFFSELLVSLYLYLLLSLTDYNMNIEVRNECGLAMLSIVLIGFIVNILSFLANVSFMIY
jgi:hypothetical protein